MQHSLRHRFRGALLGAALGETLGMGYHEAFVAKSAVSWLAIQQWKFSPSSCPVPYWSQIAVRQSQGFISGNFREAQEICLLESSLSSGNSASGNSASGNLAGIAVATLPIALFYHEDWHQLQHNLEQTASAWKIALPITPILTIAYTISLALRERLHLDTLIPRLITDLELYDRDPQLMQQLNQVQTWVQQRMGSSLVRSRVPEIPLDADSIAIAVALYSFLSTPANFQLSLLRTAQIFPQPQVACALVGALSGAYNGIAGIPLDWRRAFNAMDFPAPADALDNVRLAEAELLQQADLLWAAWSGADHPADWLKHSLPPTIASPHLIRPRHRLRGR